MKTVGSIIRAPLKLLGLIPKTPKIPDPPRPVTKDDAREQADDRYRIESRRGGSADIVTGTGGAEAGSGGASRLG